MIHQLIMVPIEKLRKADWNYKESDAFMMDRLIGNLKENGQMITLIVREIEGEDAFEVINGNHRLDALIKIQAQSVACINLGAISLAEAKRIAIETNETNFARDERAFAEMLRELEQEFDDLDKTFPLDQDQRLEAVKMLDFSWDGYDQRRTAEKSQEGRKMIEFSLSKEQIAQWKMACEKAGSDDPQRVIPAMLKNIVAVSRPSQ